MLKWVLIFLLVTPVYAKEIVKIASPYSAGSTGNVALQRVIEKANTLQNKYNLVLDIRPGGQGLVAVRTVSESSQNRLALINASYVELLENNLIQENDYIPIHAVGDACWVVASLNGNESQGVTSLRGTGDIMVGTIGAGNATHLTALAIAEKTGNSVTLVPFKSNKDALFNMAGNNGVNFVIERWENIENLKSVNPKIKVLGVSCNARLSAIPNVKTLREQGIDAPGVFMILVSSSAMPVGKQRELGALLDQATRDIGLATMVNISDMYSPVFTNESTAQFYKTRIRRVQQMQQTYQKQLSN